MYDLLGENKSASQVITLQLITGFVFEKQNIFFWYCTSLNSVRLKKGIIDLIKFKTRDNSIIYFSDEIIASVKN